MSERRYVPKRALQGGEVAPSRRAKPKGRRSPAGIIIVFVILAIELAFFVLLAATRLVPVKLLVVIGLVLLVLLVMIALLVFDPGRRGRFCVGTVIGVLIAVLLIAGILVIWKGVGTLSSITDTKKEVAHIGVYVSEDAPAQSISDVAGEAFGILAVLDRESVDQSVEQLELMLDTRVNAVEYEGLAELMDALFSGEVGAVIMNDAYLMVFEEMEGYENVPDQIRELTRVRVETEVQTIPEAEPDNKPDHVFTVYISGIDSRNGLTAKSRSDVNILATVNTQTRQVLLISTPRDYYVPLSISDGVPDKLTHAGIYGVNVSMDTIGMIYDINVDYYFRVNFEGFEDIINALGGITVHSDYTFNVGSYQYCKGDNNVDGREALVFARERKSFAEGDRQRGKNQMAVIRGVINKALSPEILTSYVSVLDAIEGSFETSVPYDLIASLVRQQLDSGDEWNIVSYSVDGTGDSRKPYSMSTKAYVMIPDEATIQTAKDMIARVCGDETLS